MRRLVTALVCAVIVSYTGALAETTIPLPDIMGSAPQKTVTDNPEGAPTPVSGNVNGGLPFILNSIFFSDAESAILEREHAIYRSALLRANLDNMDSVNGQSEAVQVPVLPSVRVKQIYLSSIIYSPSGGSVAWVNNRKFKEGESFSDLTIKKVAPDSVLLSWDLSNFTFDFNKPELTQQKAIRADEKNKILTFELRPNSRLDVAEMKILSGKTYAAPVKRLPPARPITAQGAVTNPAANKPIPGVDNIQQKPATTPQNTIMGNNSNNPTKLPPVNQAGNQMGVAANPYAQPLPNPALPNAMPPMNSPTPPPTPQQTPEDVEAAVMVENAKAAKNIQAKIKISNDLRAKGRIKEADEVDAMIRQIEPNYKKLPSGPVKLKDLGGKSSLAN